MNRKASLYAVIGGVVGAVLTMAMCSFLPLGVQSQSDGVFGEITCVGLKVVDAKGETKVWLNTDEDGGQVDVYGKAGHVVLNNDEDGGQVWVSGKTGNVWLNSEEDGGSVNVSGETGSVLLDANKRGGKVLVKGKAGHVWLNSEEAGGRIVIFKSKGIGDPGEPRVLIGVDPLGGGQVITWDKNGE